MYTVTFEMYAAVKFEMKGKLQNIVVRTKSTENSRNKISMDVFTFTVTVASRGYHVYKTTYLINAKVEDKLKRELEMITLLIETNPFNRSLSVNRNQTYAIRIKKKKTSTSLI